MEYPGYGIYQSESTTEEAILRDSERVYKYLINQLSIREDQIILMGRSLGSGPSTFLASKYKPAALILISPFTSIKKAANDLFGFFGGLFVKERFNNSEKIKDVSSPTLLIHGRKDTTVPWSHSEHLYGTFYIFLTL